MTKPDVPSDQNPDQTPTPVSSYATLEKAIAADGQDSDASGEGVPSIRGRTLTRLTAATAIVAALGTMVVDKGKPKTPRPPLVIPGDGSYGGNSPQDDNKSAGSGGDGSPETERCTPDITADGRPVQEGTCVIVFALGEDTVYKARLEKARIMIDSKTYEVEIDYGAVRGMAGDKHPHFLVRGSREFLRADMQLQGTIWVENTKDGKVATVKSETGETLVQTSWSADTKLPEGEARTFMMEAPDAGEPVKCSARWSSQKPEKDAEAWLSMLGALAVMGLARRRKNVN